MPILLRAALAALVALAFNALLRIVVRAVAHVPDAFDPFTWPPIIVATLVGVAGGTLSYLVLRAFLKERADRVFAIVAYAVLVLSLITPVTLLWSTPPQYPGTTLLTVLSLEAMHISTALATIIALTRNRAPGVVPLSSLVIVALTAFILAPAAGVRAADEDNGVTQFYARAVKVMDGLPQPPFVTYRLEGTGNGFQIGLTVRDQKVWLLIYAGSGSSAWTLRHRTYDYQSEIIDQDDRKRYLSARSFFDPTWYGAYRALREGMLNAQDPAPPRPSPDDPSPAPVTTLRTIGGIAVMGPALYRISDRGAAVCPDGSPGRALHLTSRTRDPLRQLTDVVVNVDSLRLCMMRYGVNGAFGFHGIVEQHYADVGGYWMQTDGLLDGTQRAFGISTHHGIWHYRLLDMAFPATLPPDAFAPDVSAQR